MHHIRKPNHTSVFMKNPFLFSFLMFFLFTSCGQEEETEIFGEIGVNGAVSTAHPLASAIGLKVLEDGGNAFDAAVAIHFALAVTYPRAGNIAGGGFAVFRLKNGEAGTLDFRETAPSKASRDMYLDESGVVIPGLSRNGALAVGVPGSVAGMQALHEKFGKLSWSALVEPAVVMARQGIILTDDEADIINEYDDEIAAANSFVTAFQNPEGWEPGDTLKQPDLARTLEKIKGNGRKGFYEGEVAALIGAEMERNGGIISLADLLEYKPVWRKAIRGKYKQYDIISMPPPSAGGLALIQLMKGIENYPVAEWGHNVAKTVHVMTELERRVYADRSTYLGDPDFVPVPVKMLTDTNYLNKRFESIDLDGATSSQEIKEGEVKKIESLETTHYSIVDSEGNAVSITTTLNGNFGSKLMVEGGGFFLNNEMDDFSAKPGTPNMYGLVGSEANEIEAGKRMLSSMTPTILEKDGELFMVVGTPGGSTIITSVFQTILNVIEHDMTMQEAINAKRLHHQWLPDYVIQEKAALKFETIVKLFLMGHVLLPTEEFGRVDGILIREDGSLEAAADFTRGDDTAFAF